MKLVLNIHWKDWCWNWNSNTLGTWCKELTHWKRPWYWERLKAGGEGDDRGWDGWMASLTQWTWVLVGSGSWWWTGRPGVLEPIGSQRVRCNWSWATELNWTLSKLDNSTSPYPQQHRAAITATQVLIYIDTLNFVFFIFSSSLYIHIYICIYMYIYLCIFELGKICYIILLFFFHVLLAFARTTIFPI